MLIFLAVLALIGLSVWLFMQQPVFGNNPDDERLTRIEQSPNYRDGAFQNLSPTPALAEGVSVLKILQDSFNKSPNNVPKQVLPAQKTDLRTLPDSLPTVVWFGHSSYLIKSRGVSVLIDPVFSDYASPVPIFGKAFPSANPYTATDMPPIDLLVLTHDHYDHLDYETIKQLAPTVTHFYTALGVGAHLERWGIAPDKITEFDWWESNVVSPEINLTAVPGRHFSGRGFVRAKTLWMGFVLNLHGSRLFLGGDSGYDTHFAEIGRRFGPFDLAMVECGQYGINWPDIHLLPEKTAQAALDLRAKVLLPVHWAKFSLAFHAWNEPIERLLPEAARLHLTVTTPKIGEPVVLGKTLPNSRWW
jgi:L-ascorbate metabolism protein UlaG (beta-lactamase superfamily)